jgi:hypothetical protein
MPPQRNVKPTYNKGTLLLAIQATQANALDSIKYTSRAFNVPKTMLRQQRARKPPRCDCKPNLKKLDKLEEEALVQHILNLDQRGIGATRAIVQDIANNLLAKRSREPVSKHWVDNFKTRTLEIKLKRSCLYNC